MQEIFFSDLSREMVKMEHANSTKPVTLRFFAQFYFLMKARGLFSCLEIFVPENGKTAFEIAMDIGLPIEKIDAVFRNGLIQNLYDKLFPGDRAAFVPYGTPGPYRVYLGMMRENIERMRREKLGEIHELEKNKINHYEFRF